MSIFPLIVRWYLDILESPWLLSGLPLSLIEMIDVESAKPKLRYISEGHAHYSEGTAGDSNIYVDDDGYNVKLDKLGRRYRVRSDGVRGGSYLPSSRNSL